MAVPGPDPGLSRPSQSSEARRSSHHDHRACSHPRRHGRLVPAIPIAWSAELLFIGITALDTLSRHHRACPGHPGPVRYCAFPIGIPGTSPGMTAEGSGRAKGNVLTLFLTLCFICAIPLLIPARRGARSRGVARVGRGAVLQQASQACWQEALGSPVLVQVRLKVPRARRRPALPFHHPHRAGLPIAPPSINHPARSASCGPTGAGPSHLSIAIGRAESYSRPSRPI
jgi:hypothetical protein